MNNILIPEKNLSILKKYHSGSALLLPFIAGSVASRYTNNKYMVKWFDCCNVFAIGFHSYVSTSCIITDYVKPRYISTGTRSLSFVLHNIAIYGYLKNIIQRN